MSKEFSPTVEIIKGIPNYPFTDDEIREARRASIGCGLLGGDFFPDSPQGPDEFEGDHETWREEVWQRWKDWKTKFNSELDNWQIQHSWIPRRNFKNSDTFARAFYYNPRARKFMENLDSATGETLMQRLGYHSGMHMQWMLTVPAEAGSVQERQESFRENQTLTDFCLDYMSYFINGDERKMAGIPSSSDGDAARQFWTTAPYLYQGLKEQGLDNAKVIEAVLDWGSARMNATDQKPYDADYPGMTNLRELSYGNDVGWYLSRDPADASHQLSKRVGNHIAQQIAPLYRMQKLSLWANAQRRLGFRR